MFVTVNIKLEPDTRDKYNITPSIWFKSGNPLRVVKNRINKSGLNPNRIERTKEKYKGYDFVIINLIYTDIVEYRYDFPFFYKVFDNLKK